MGILGEKEGYLMKQYEDLLEKLTEGLIRIFGKTAVSIILYGSAARGTQTAESDIDIAVLQVDHTPEMHDRMTDLIVELELEYDVVLSVLLIDYNNYLEWKDTLPFYRNVRREGITLWQAA